MNSTVTAGADRLLQLFLQLDAQVGDSDLYEPMTRHVERLARVVDESPRPAEAALVGAIALLQAQRPERVRDHVHYLSRLAKCQLLAGEAERACQTGMQALDLALMVSSARAVERIAEFDAGLVPVTTSAARDFRKRFAVFARSC